LRRLLVAVLLFAASSASADVSGIDPNLFQDLHWRLIGPFRGGRVLAVSGVPGEPEHFYFGSVNGGVWETQDAGRTWQPIFDSQPIGSIGALAVAPSNPRILYVGSGEADMRIDIAQGDGVYKSTDGGKTWMHIGLVDSQQIGRVIVHPTNPDVVYVAALGHPYGPNAERGVFRSRDGGATWQKVLGPGQGAGDEVGAIDIAFEPGNPQVLYAALWRTRRTPWHIYPPSNGPGSGLFKSTDGGDTWKPLSGLPKNPGRIGIAVARTQPQRVYAMVDQPEAGGLYRSDDGGATWTHASGDNRIWGRGWYFGGIAVEPKNADVIYACNTALYRSDDAGKTFVPVKGAPGGDDYHELWIDPQEPQRRILGVDQGTVVSLDGGATWSSWYNQPTGQFYHVITDSRFPYWVYGSQQDSGAAGVPSRTDSFNGINLTQFREIVPGGENDNIAPDPRDPDVIYGGRVGRLDLRTGQTQTIDPDIAYPDLYRDAWTQPLTFSTRDPRALYFAHQRVFRTEDGGQHWTVISPDLTREDPGTPANLDPVTAENHQQIGPRRGVIYAIAPSRTADHDLWIGTDDGLIWRTRDEGKNWTNVTPAALTPWSKIGILDASHFDAETAYAAIDRHRLDDFKPYVYRTHDGGKSWDLIASGIPDGSFVNAVREDPVRKGLLYAGTEKGMYVSFDDGDHWQALQRNLPVTSVRDIDVHGDDVVIGTHGRAFWVLDDVTPLRELAEKAAQVQAASSWLFEPTPAVRFRPAGFTGTPLPQDEPMAHNPSAGAMIDYVLKAAAKQVALEIHDEKGGLVRRYTSADAAPKTDLGKIVTAPQWVVPPSTLSAVPGMHRFAWPLRYAQPAALAEGDPWADGVWAPPGRYTVVLDVDGHRLTQPLTIAPDPRIALPAAAYAAQFALARRIEDTRARLAAATHEADTLQSALKERRAKASPETGTALDAFQAKLDAISGGTRWWIPPKSTATFRFSGDALEKLANAVDGADAAPTPDATAGFNKVQSTLTATLASWETLKTKDLAALNAQLKKAGQPPVVLKP
jgi:photosystem II stability/assembly factor-like uncharacterized protein